MMPTTFEILNEIRQPKFINTRSGFMLIDHAADGKLWLLGFTANLRTATPLYCSNGVALDVANKLMKQSSKTGDYFAIIEPSLIGYNREKEK
jgi:hypothetical protein